MARSKNSQNSDVAVKATKKTNLNSTKRGSKKSKVVSANNASSKLDRRTKSNKVVAKATNDLLVEEVADDANSSAPSVSVANANNRNKRKATQLFSNEVVASETIKSYQPSSNSLAEVDYDIDSIQQQQHGTEEDNNSQVSAVSTYQSCSLDSFTDPKDSGNHWDRQPTNMCSLNRLYNTASAMRAKGLHINEHWVSSEVPIYLLPNRVDNHHEMQVKLKFHSVLRQLKDRDPNAFISLIDMVNDYKGNDFSFLIKMAESLLMQSLPVPRVRTYNISNTADISPYVNLTDTTLGNMVPNSTNTYSELKILPPSKGPGSEFSLSGIRIGFNKSTTSDKNNDRTSSEHGLVQVVNNRDLSKYTILGKLEESKMKNLINYLDMEVRAGRGPNLMNHFTPETLSLLSSTLAATNYIPMSDVIRMDWFRTWNFRYFLDVMIKIYNQELSNTTVPKEIQYFEALNDAIKKFNFDSIDKVYETIHDSLVAILLDLGEPTPAILQDLLKRFYDSLKRKSHYVADDLSKYVDKYLKQLEGQSIMLVHWITAIGSYINESRIIISKSDIFNKKGYYGSSKSDPHHNNRHTSLSKGNGNKHKGNGNSSSHKPSTKTQGDKAKHASQDLCNGCGMNHSLSACDMKKHPDYNHKTDISWVNTDQYAKLTEFYPKDPKKRFLKRYLTLDGKHLEGYIAADKRHKDNNRNDKNKKSGQNETSGNEILLPNISNEFTDIKCNLNDFLSCTISTGDHHLSVHSLIDSGAVHANYCSENIAKWIKERQKDNPSLHPCKLDDAQSNVCSVSRLAHSDLTITSNNVVSFNFNFVNELTNMIETLSCLHFKVIKTDIDIIIGRPTIRKFLLSSKLPSVFGGITSVEPRPPAMVRPAAEFEILPEPKICTTQFCDSCMNICPECAPFSLGAVTECSSNTAILEEIHTGTKSYIFGSNRSELRDDGHKVLGALQSPPQRLSTASSEDICCSIDREVNIPEQVPHPRTKPTTIHRREFLGDPINDDEISDHGSPIDNLNKDELSSDELLDLVTIEGPPILQAKLKALCREYRDIFSTTVRSQPSKVPPMNFEIDLDKWQNKRNRLPPRVQCPDKQREILKQIKLLLDLDIIEVSTASEWSQVHMVPKPATPNEWRFTIDYVKLNESTIGMEGWPITIISALFQRLGAKRHNYFGILDMTSGYFQGPLAPECRVNSAFMTLYGLYQWKRCPMGLKGAGQYFQRVMSSTVLAGLIYDICELYIDDVLISGESEEAYLANVRAVFQRFREFGVVIHPKKAKLGLTELEYVGHLIDKTGLHFSQEKRLEVLNFPTPSTQKHVQMFLGLANYFRDHVSHITELLAPLREMIVDYDKRKKVVWTPDRLAAFERAKTAIHDCQKLFFIDENVTPILQTDASDYGIGGMLYQIINGLMYPIMYISKALQGSQYNWSTIEKECYAIFFCINKLKPILGNSHFILKTDHKNLTAFKDHEKNCKVTRWKHALMEENFSIEYVPGTEYHQTVPDALSRLVEDSRPKSDILNILTEQSPDKLSLNMIMPAQKSTHIPDEIYSRIGKFHSTRVGHFAADRVFDRMKSANEIDFKNPLKWIKLFVAQCPCCQLMDRLKLRIKTRPFVTSSLTPFQTVCLDHIGPLKDSNGEEFHILVIIDCFSRWVELYTVNSTTAIETANCLFEFYGRYGSAETISTDNGPAFFNAIVQQLVLLGGSDYQYTTPYSHEENGIVERHNAEVIKHLRAIFFDKRILTIKDIKLCLPIVQRIMNTLEKALTGLTPAEMLFGNNLRLTERILSRPSISSPGTTPVKLSEYMDKLLSRQEIILKVAREKQAAQTAFHMQEVNPNYTEYPINSYVLYTPPKGKRREKLRMTHDGPYQVLNKINDIYTIENLVTGKPFDCHITSLRPFIFDPLRVIPKEVAVQNNQEFFIEKILAHQGDPNRKPTMYFKVRWLGYSEDHDTWEPYYKLRDTEQLIEYLNSHRLRRLVLPKYK